jgi:hypothetical protein
MANKNLNEFIEERTRDLTACSTVLQPTAPPRTLYQLHFSYLSRKLELEITADSGNEVHNVASKDAY